MKTVLINPPYSRDCCSPHARTPVPSLGLLYIAAFLEKYGYDDLKIIEAPILKLTVEKLGDILQKEDPDIVGITSNAYIHKNALKVAEVAKKNNPNVSVVVGGPHATFVASEIMTKNYSVDIVARGEGEYTMLELVEVLEKGGKLETVKGIVFREGNKIKATPPRPSIHDLDALPFPARHLLPMELYRATGHAASMITSRGCPYQCIFCASGKFWGPKVRFRRPTCVVDEIRELVDKYRFDEIDVVDDTFTLNEKRVTAICDEITQRELDFHWSCNARVDTISRKLLKEMKQAHCCEIFFGAESGSQKVLDTCRKGITVQQIRDGTKLAKEMGFRVIVSFVLGLPGENMDTINETISLIKSLPCDEVLINPLIPLPGTEVYENPRKWGIKIVNLEWSDFVEFSIETKELPIEKFREAYLRTIKAVPLKSVA